MRTPLALVALSAVLGLGGCTGGSAPAAAPAWEADNPLKALPAAPLGVEGDLAAVKPAVTPEKVRLGRWLFYDGRLSSDGTISCASCHRPENAFSELTPHSTGVKGQQGARKAPSFVNGAWPLAPVFFWDGRAASLAEQAKGPIQNPIEMGETHASVVARIGAIAGYRPYFKEAFGDEAVTIDRVAEAIASYEATRMSGNSAYDRFHRGDKAAMSAAAVEGEKVFFGKAKCAQCHLGWNFTDSQFHNLGVGWDPAAGKLADEGRSKVSGKPADAGAFKTPTLRDVAKHAPYMHDGSLATLRDVVKHYDKGGVANPTLDRKVVKLGLTEAEVDALVEFMKALDGEGYQDTAPRSFPQ